MFRRQSSVMAGLGCLHTSQTCSQKRNRAGFVFQGDISTPDRRTATSENRKEIETELVRILRSQHGKGGSETGHLATLRNFMKQALMHPEHGYYSTKKRVIGSSSDITKSDFITAPEIPLFSETLANWCVDVWSKMGTPRKINLVELGPGRGTMMRKILRSIQHTTPQLYEFLDVHLVELGQARREEQSKSLKDFQKDCPGKLNWWMELTSVPTKGVPTIYLANEWFDALPLQKFVWQPDGWWEYNVLPCDDPRTEAHFRYELWNNGFGQLSIPKEIREDKTKKYGQTFEVNTEGMAAMETLGKKMFHSGKSVALIIDYGADAHLADSLRGIKNHRLVNPLLSPGDIDLTFDVSFRQLKLSLASLECAHHLECRGPITQADFLSLNGIDCMLANSIKDLDTKRAMTAISNFKKLMDDEHMGKDFKVMAVQTKSLPPVSPWFY